jgi:hypothetical protein
MATVTPVMWTVDCTTDGLPAQFIQREFVRRAAPLETNTSQSPP